MLTSFRDLSRDPRFGLHTATIDTQVSDGDAMIWGVVHKVQDLALHHRYAECLFQETRVRPARTIQEEVQHRVADRPALLPLQTTKTRSGGPCGIARLRSRQDPDHLPLLQWHRRL